MTESTPMPAYAPHLHRGERRFGLAWVLSACFFLSHICAELLIWWIYFYVLGHWHATTDNLFDLDRFQFSMAVETVLAAVGAFMVFSAFLAQRFRPGYGSVWLIVSAVTFGIAVDALPWILVLGPRFSDLGAIAIILGLSFAAAVGLTAIARAQVRKYDAATVIV